MNKVKKDYIKIAYAKGDALYVPVTQLDLEMCIRDRLQACAL